MITHYPEEQNRVIAELNAVLDFARNNSESNLYRDLPKASVANLYEFGKFPILTQKTLMAKNVVFKRFPDFERFLSVTRKNLLAEDMVLRHFTEKEIRYLVSEFSPDNTQSLFLIPQRFDTVWTSFDRELQGAKPKAALAALPLFWQLGPLFYQACRKNEVPASVMTNPADTPLIAAVLKEIEAQAVVTTPEIAQELSELFHKTTLKAPLRFWHLVTSLAEQYQFRAEAGAMVFIEKHLFPGIPIAYQCAHLAARQQELFHPSPMYFWEFVGSQALITSLTKEALPLIRYQIGEPITAVKEKCQCGQDLSLVFSS